MARLTYQNVNAPNWNITGGLALANATLGNALKGFSDSLGDFKAADQANADAILRERMLGLKTEDDFYNALQSGSLLDGISGRITAKAAENAWKDRNNLLTQDANRLQYNIDTALAGASDLQSAIEVALTNGDVAGYNRIISSEPFLNLPVQAQQKLMGDINQELLNRARASSIGRADRISNEAADLKERYSWGEANLNKDGTIEGSQKIFDDLVKFAHENNYSSEAIQQLRNAIPSLTKTGFDGRVGGNVISNNASQLLDEAALRGADITDKYVTVDKTGNPQLADIDSATQSVISNNNNAKRLISQQLGVPESFISAYADASNGKLDINEISATVQKAFGLDSDDALNYANELYSLVSTGQLSPRAARALAQTVPPEDPWYSNILPGSYTRPNLDGVQRYKRFESNRGVSQLVSVFKDLDKNNEKVSKASQALKEAKDTNLKAKSAINSARTQANERTFKASQENVNRQNQLFLAALKNNDQNTDTLLRNIQEAWHKGKTKEQLKEEKETKERQNNLIKQRTVNDQIRRAIQEGDR